MDQRRPWADLYGDEDLPQVSASQQAPAHQLPPEVCRRLRLFWKTLSIEISPEDVGQQVHIGDAHQGLLDFLPNATSSMTHPLAPGTVVYINVVRQEIEHFSEVVAAISALKAAGYKPVPHLPASRFASRDAFKLTFEALARAGAYDFLVMGGNDFAQRAKASECTFREGATTMITEEIGLWKKSGLSRVAVCGFPDGHPAFGFSASATSAMLSSKVRSLFEAGMDVTVVTQFSFHPGKLVQWLARTRKELHSIRAEFGDSNRLFFRIGLPSPVDRKKLAEIARACHVPVQLCPSAFSLVDTDHDGKITLDDLKTCEEQLNLKHKGDELEADFKMHAHANGTMNEAGFCELLVEDAVGGCKTKYVMSKVSSYPCITRQRASSVRWSCPLCEYHPDGKAPSPVEGHLQREHPLCQEACVLPFSTEEPRAHSAVGPSVFVGHHELVQTGYGYGPQAKPVPLPSCGSGTSTGELVKPGELLLVLATFCQAKSVPDEEVAIHFFPFGGLPTMLELTSALRAGDWPMHWGWAGGT